MLTDPRTDGHDLIKRCDDASKNEETFRRNIRGGKMISRREKGVKSYASFSLKSITSQMEKKGKLRKHFCRGRDDLETPETVSD